jgi:hypothetical protein
MSGRPLDPVERQSAAEDEGQEEGGEIFHARLRELCRPRQLRPAQSHTGVEALARWAARDHPGERGRGRIRKTPGPKPRALVNSTRNSCECDRKWHTGVTMSSRDVWHAVNARRAGWFLT